MLAAERPLHLLVNNVGACGLRWQTADGIEASFALNHLSPVVLTERPETLPPALREHGDQVR
jgi:hypothetical protein